MRDNLSSPRPVRLDQRAGQWDAGFSRRSEEHTSELQSPCNLVCRLLLEKKKKSIITIIVINMKIINKSFTSLLIHDTTIADLTMNIGSIQCSVNQIVVNRFQTVNRELC